MTSKFVKLYFFLIFAYPENLMRLAQTIKKFEFCRPGLRGTPNSGTAKF